jgi:hypothetical protein
LGSSEISTGQLAGPPKPAPAKKTHNVGLMTRRAIAATPSAYGPKKSLGDAKSRG